MYPETKGYSQEWPHLPVTSSVSLGTCVIVTSALAAVVIGPDPKRGT